MLLLLLLLLLALLLSILMPLDTVPVIYFMLTSQAGHEAHASVDGGGRGRALSAACDLLGRVSTVTNPLGTFTYSYVDAT